MKKLSHCDSEDLAPNTRVNSSDKAESSPLKVQASNCWGKTSRSVKEHKEEWVKLDLVLSHGEVLHSVDIWSLLSAT